MARRRRRQTIALTFLTEAYVRVAGTIVLDTLACSIWNVGSRSPAGALRDVRRHVSERRPLAPGIVRALIGVIFVVAGAVLLLPAIADPRSDLAPFQIFAIVVALGLEHFIGADIRSIVQTVR